MRAAGLPGTLSRDELAAENRELHALCTYQLTLLAEIGAKNAQLTLENIGHAVNYYTQRVALLEAAETQRN